MTTLTITPDTAKKRLKFSGTVASGEKVAVTVAGFGSEPTTDLRLRVMAGNTAVGVFPLEDGDEWEASGSDLTCTLNLATEQAERLCKFGAEVFFILEDTGTPQMYGGGNFSLLPWVKLAGVDVPVNLENYKVKYEELCQRIDDLGTELENKYEKPDSGIPLTDLSQSVRTSIEKANAVTLKVPKSAFDELLGLSLPDSATQKDTRQIVQRILGVLQNAATCALLAFALPALGIDPSTAWEDVPPQNKVKAIVEQFAPVKSVNGKTGVVEVTASDISCTNSAGAGTVQSVFDAFRNGYNANIPYFLQGHTSSAEEKRWDGLLYGAGHTFDWRVNSNYDVGFNWILVDDIILKGWSEDGDHSLTNALRRLGNSTSPDAVTWQGLGMFAETGTVHYAIDADGATTAQRLHSPDGVYYVGDLKRESTNAAVAVVREMSLGGIWDKRLNVWWTPVMENGALTYQATTNVNLNAGGN